MNIQLLVLDAVINSRNTNLSAGFILLFVPLLLAIIYLASKEEFK